MNNLSKGNRTRDTVNYILRRKMKTEKKKIYSSVRINKKSVTVAHPMRGISELGKWDKHGIFYHIISRTFNLVYCIHAAAAKSLQSCLTLCDPTDGSPPGSPIPGILQARTLEWVAISFSNA